MQKHAFASCCIAFCAPYANCNHSYNYSSSYSYKSNCSHICKNKNTRNQCKAIRQANACRMACLNNIIRKRIMLFRLRRARKNFLFFLFFCDHVEAAAPIP